MTELCPHFGPCGGCTAQDMAQPAYQTWKSEALRKTLERTPPVTWLDPVFVPDRTRRRVTLAALRVSKSDFRLGFHMRRDTTIIDAPGCIITHPDLQAFLNAARPYLAAMLPFQKPVDILVQMADNGIDILLTGPIGPKGKPDMDVHHAVMDMAQALPDLARIAWRARERDRADILLAPRQPIMRFEDLIVPLPVGAFLQPSLNGESALRNAVQSAIATHAPHAGRVLDLFCGCGTLTPALLSAPYVQALDSDTGAIAALQSASKAIPRLHVAQRDLFRQPLSVKELNGFDAVLLDPARAGAADQCAALAKSSVPLVIYVSCAPNTFTRDAGTLISGGYTLASAQLIDQFTYTPHSEVVGVFVRAT